MKVMLISFVVGVGVGLIYGLIRVKSPAPPIVALLGLLGMVLGEQAADWFHAKRAAHAAVATARSIQVTEDLPRAPQILPTKND
jgi:XapX domain-containing protein